MKSSIIKRSVVIGGNKTSVSLENEFWQGLKEIAQGQRTTLSNTVAEIDRCRQKGNLSSAIRLFVLDWVRANASGAVRPLEADGTHVESGKLSGERAETRV